MALFAHQLHFWGKLLIVNILDSRNRNAEHVSPGAEKSRAAGTWVEDRTEMGVLEPASQQILSQGAASGNVRTA
jgi:hypothetical protein